MRTVHWATFGVPGSVACGAQSSWRKRIAAKHTLDLQRTRDVDAVTCKRCLGTGQLHLDNRSTKA